MDSMQDRQPISAKPLSEQISERIVRMIVDNEWSAGDKLPNEFELAERLCVGRSTLREAIKALVSRNVLEIRRGAGTFVSQKCGVADDPLQLSQMKNKFKIAWDLLEIRFMIEPEISSIAATKATAEEVERMTRLCDEVEELILTGQPYIPRDIELHTQIAQSSKNQIVANLIPIINQSIEVFTNLTERKLRTETIETHRDVVDAIRAHDANKARNAMLLHLVYNRRNIQQLIHERKINL